MKTTFKLGKSILKVTVDQETGVPQGLECTLGEVETSYEVSKEEIPEVVKATLANGKEVREMMTAFRYEVVEFAKAFQQMMREQDEEFESKIRKIDQQGIINSFNGVKES